MITLSGFLLLPLFVTRPDVTVERAALDLWELHRAELSYAESNRGYFDSILCLRMPGDCIPEYDVRAAASFLPEFHQGQWGYFVTYHPGPLVDPEGAREELSPTSVETFAITSVMVAGGSNPYRPALCLDASGRVCVYTDGSEPRVEDGQCAGVEVADTGITFEGRERSEVGALIGEIRYRRTSPVHRLLVSYRIRDAASRLALALVLALALLFFREKDLRVGNVLGTTAALFFLPVLVYAPVAWFLNGITR